MYNIDKGYDYSYMILFLILLGKKLYNVFLTT